MATPWAITTTASCAELLLREDGSVKLIRRAETPADYFATLYGCDELLDGAPYDEEKLKGK